MWPPDPRPASRPIQFLERRILAIPVIILGRIQRSLFPTYRGHRIITLNINTGRGDFFRSPVDQGRPSPPSGVGIDCCGSLHSTRRAPEFRKRRGYNAPVSAPLPAPLTARLSARLTARLSSPRLIVASRSARRARLLTEAGYTFEQMDPPYDDTGAALDGDPIALAQRLAHAKCSSIIESNDLRVLADVVCLCADTLVVAPDGRLFGQPVDRPDARRMLDSLIGQTHQVVTAVVLHCVRSRRERSFADVARVTIGSVATATLTAYLDSGRWRSKAGGYNLAEIDGHWSLGVDGDPTTVVGLPMAMLVPALADMSILPSAGPLDDGGGGSGAATT